MLFVSRNNLSFLVVFFGLINPLFAQFEGYTPTYPVQSTELYNKANLYQKDFLYFCDALESTHPDVYLFFTRDEFQNEKALTLEKLSSCGSVEELALITTAFIVPIQDTHTSVSGINLYSSRSYPIRCKYYGDSLDVVGTTDQVPRDYFGSIITSINGVPLKEIEKRTSRVVRWENRVSLKNALMLNVSNAGFLKLLSVVNSDSEIVVIETEDHRTLVMAPNSNSKWIVAYKQGHSVAEKKPVNFDYQIIKEKDLCYLQFNTFVDRSIATMYADLMPFWKRMLVKSMLFFHLASKGVNRYFTDFLNDMIEDCEKNGIKNVVVDLRYNSGGSFLLGDVLLYSLGVDSYRGYSSERKESDLYKVQYANVDLPHRQANTEIEDTTIGLVQTKNAMGVDEIKKRFHGRVYFLVSEWTYSSAIMLATIVKDNKLFPVVGEETSEKPSHFGEKLFLRLPNTRLVCTISCKHFHRPDKGRDDEETLYPDIPVYKTFESLVNGVDPAYEWILSDIGKN